MLSCPQNLLYQPLPFHQSYNSAFHTLLSIKHQQKKKVVCNGSLLEAEEGALWSECSPPLPLKGTDLCEPLDLTPGHPALPHLPSTSLASPPSTLRVQLPTLETQSSVCSTQQSSVLDYKPSNSHPLPSSPPLPSGRYSSRQSLPSTPGLPPTCPAVGVLRYECHTEV